MVAKLVSENDAPPDGCPRCLGRVVVTRDVELGRQFSCLACGHNPPTAADRRRLAVIKREEILPAGRIRRRQPSHKYRSL